jgi:hypothetical protein
MQRIAPNARVCEEARALGGQSGTPSRPESAAVRAGRFFDVLQDHRQAAVGRPTVTLLINFHGDQIGCD